MKIQGEFMREELKNPQDQICMMIMKYFTLEFHYKVIYYYHLPLLNHFCSNYLLCLLFFLLHSLEVLIKEVVDPKKWG